MVSPPVTAVEVRPSDVYVCVVPPITVLRTVPPIMYVPGVEKEGEPADVMVADGGCWESVPAGEVDAGDAFVETGTGGTVSAGSSNCNVT